MRRLVFATALLGLVGSLVAGCFDTSAVERPNGAECGQGYDPYTYDPAAQQETAASCEGGWCLVLNQNKQGMAGLCSKACTVDSECTPHDSCVSLPQQGTFCFRKCQTDDDCFDSFVCRQILVGDTHKFCLVDPV